MAKHHESAGQSDARPPRHSVDGGLTSSERSLIRRLIEVLRLADLFALLMVAATAFSAFATWRTAQVTSQVFAVEERPFVGVERVTFERGDGEYPRAVVEYRNFGRIPASGAIVSVVTLVNGRRAAEVPNEMSSIMAGMLSPGVPHYFYRYLSPEIYQSVMSGKSTIMLDIQAEYSGPRGGPFCNSERMVFDYRSLSFRPAGGTNSCSRTDIY
jgi:hypothetical protein